MLATGTDQFSIVADTSFIGRSALNNNTNWQSILAGSNDDAGVLVLFSILLSLSYVSIQWIVLALWKIADYKNNRGQESDAYLVRFARERRSQH